MTDEDLRSRYRFLLENVTGVTFSRDAAATVLAAEIVAEAIRELKVNSYVDETFLNEFGPLLNLANK